jgi:hypothetical protein
VITNGKKWWLFSATFYKINLSVVFQYRDSFHTRFSATRFILAVISDNEVCFDRYRHRRYPQSLKFFFFVSPPRGGETKYTLKDTYLSFFLPALKPFSLTEQLPPWAGTIARLTVVSEPRTILLCARLLGF